MEPLVISLARAKRIILHAAGLTRPAQFGKGKEAVLKFIHHLGFLQVDTNYVVERAHHHAIAARVPNYDTDWLFELQDEGRIFEFWTFASGFIPIDDFRFSFPVKEALTARRKNLTQKDINLMQQILDRIGREGPLMARDFEHDRLTKSTGWWDWRPSKIALERLHSEGRLISIRRRDFQKQYDLTENVIPPVVDQAIPTREEFARHVVLRSLKAWGIGEFKDVAYRGRYVKNHVIKSELKNLIDEGVVTQITLAERPQLPPLYMLTEYRTKKISLSNDVFILSPFDVLNVLRHRLKNYFGFDYQVECFVPEKKRKYGYFALPILWGELFIARMDAKADRKQGVLIVNNLHFESVELPGQAIKKLAQSIREFVRFNACQHVVFIRGNHKNWMQKLVTELADIHFIEKSRTKNLRR